MSKQVGPDDEQSRQVARDRTFRRYPNINKQLLTDLYYQQGLSTVEIAKTLGVARNTIWEYMEMYDLERRKPGEAGAIRQHTHQVNEDFFSCIDTDDKAYIIGLILGDGMLTDRRKAKRLRIDLVESDGYLLDRIAILLGDAILVRRIPRANPTEQPKARLVVNRTRMVNDLIAAGVPLGKKSGREPFIRFSTERLTWNFIRGVFDADGHIGINARQVRWSITCGLPFVSGLRDYLADRGITLSPKSVSSVSGTGVIISAKRDTIREIGRHMYQYGTLWLQRKKDIFDLLG